MMPPSMPESTTSEPKGCPVSGRRIPLGWPVVPDEYSIAEPSTSSASGAAGDPATNSSYDVWPAGGRADHEAQLDVRRAPDQLGGQRRERLRGDERAGAAVHDDVGRLVGRQVGVDHRVVEARPLQGEGHLVGAVVVGQEDRHVVAGTQPMGEQGLGQAARALLELGERDDLARGGDDGGALAVAGGVRGGAEMDRAALVGAHRPLLAHREVGAPTREGRMKRPPTCVVEV